jgi:hypothetical protein
VSPTDAVKVPVGAAGVALTTVKEKVLSWNSPFCVHVALIVILYVPGDTLTFGNVTTRVELLIVGCCESAGGYDLIVYVNVHPVGAVGAANAGLVCDIPNVAVPSESVGAHTTGKAVHRANRSIPVFAVISQSLPLRNAVPSKGIPLFAAVIRVPPVRAVHQPSKVYPVLVSVGRGFVVTFIPDVLNVSWLKVLSLLVWLL